MGMLAEFKQFAMRGNVVDMAVGVVIGGAFGKIVASLVGDIIMPIVGFLTGGMDFKDLVITLKAPVDTLPSVTIRYGTFLSTVLDFLIIAFSIFIAIKIANKVARTQVASTVAK